MDQLRILTSLEGVRERQVRVKATDGTFDARVTQIVKKQETDASKGEEFKHHRYRQTAAGIQRESHTKRDHFSFWCLLLLYFQSFCLPRFLCHHFLLLCSRYLFFTSVSLFLRNVCLLFFPFSLVSFLHFQW